MRYLSVCSGIGCETVAWRPLGWECAAFAEIDRQASAVLAHHYPDVPNVGDFTKISGDEHGTIDLLAGGTPCQSFSVAGVRRGLDDDRGGLALEFCRLAERTRARWVVWENVPGVLSLDEGRAFGSIVGALVELGYSVAWRVLDAQYVRVQSHARAVPQRRRRVFVVGHFGADWRPPAAVLLEPEGLRGDSPPRREAGQAVAALTSAGVGTCGADDNQAQGGHLIAPPLTHNPYGDHEAREGLLVAYGGNRTSGPIDVATAIVSAVAPTVSSHGPPYARTGQSRVESEALVAFSCKDHGADADGEVSPTIAMQERMESLNPENDPNGKGWRDDGAAFTIESRNRPQSVAFAENSRAEVRLEDGDGQVSGCLGRGGGKPGQGYPTLATDLMVRRITPLEAERLMGLPDGYTAIRYKGKPLRDGPRYRLIGNGIAVNVARWIAERIAMYERLTA